MPFVVRRIGSILGITLLVIVVLYAGMRTKDLVFGPGLKLPEIPSGVKGDQILTLSGTAKQARELSINGRTVPTELSGAFTETLILVPGYNVVSVKSKDLFGHTVEKTFATYYTPTTPATVAQAPTDPSEL